MLHTHDDFLNAIAAQPADRTLRLVYADWLDERADPRGELIRVEEQMRQLPVFADRFWELKLRRNELRTHAGAEWCGQMRYGTECEPVFRHGIPDGWRERWRLIREFTERWHRIPMPDVGGRWAEIIEAEVRLGRRVPPSVREWIAFRHDVPVDTTDSYSFGVLD
ncbi:TIGR02996 domain-containing protein [Frigoriglobus tundricola]|nr:TIGR02996 domain-containing protein [Frigoriglobus tundricola]